MPSATVDFPQPETPITTTASRRVEAAGGAVMAASIRGVAPIARER
jgi:hypothetical protein